MKRYLLLAERYASPTPMLVTSSYKVEPDTTIITIPYPYFAIIVSVLPLKFGALNNTH
jgi:hypothetical protein